jgi:hypothetical protein
LCLDETVVDDCDNHREGKAIYSIFAWRQELLKRLVPILIFIIPFAFAVGAVFGEGQTEGPWHVVDGGNGRLYFFTEATDGCGMFSIDFVEGKRVEYQVNCDKTIDTGWCVKVCVRSNGGVLCEQDWLETQDHTGVSLVEDQPSAFLTKLENTDSIEFNVATCDGTYDHTFSLKGLSKIMMGYKVLAAKPPA